MLRGANEIYERFQQELGVAGGGVTADGLFSLEEVECIGACSWAPAIQVNYDFHDELTPELVAGILAGYREQAWAPGDGSSSTGQQAQAEGGGASSQGCKADAEGKGTNA
jgi:hypothetical protein